MEQQEIKHTRKSNKKPHFFTFKGLGCTAPAQVSVPTMIRSSASWEGKKVREKKIITPVRDVWCGPGSGLSTDVDCVVSSRRNNNNNNNNNVVVSGRAKIDVEKINNVRERGSCSGRRMVHPEEDHLPFFDTDTRMPHEHRLRVFGSRHHRHLRHRAPHGLSEIVTLQGNLLMGGRLDHDQYRDWRLDLDNMSYEELLELGDKIGYVCTGLREDEIHRCVRKAKGPVVSEDKSSSRIPTEMQWKCTVCQEEYEEEDEIGKLDCGHFYHMYCIKQWLAQKKTCPICKAEAAVKS